MLIESISGVRGIWGDVLTEEVVTRYAHAYAQFVQKHIEKESYTCVIGRDTRESGPRIAEIISTIWSQHYGFEVIDVGMATTPVTQHAVRYTSADGGVIITASHNEPEYNGMKFLRGNGGVLQPDEMQWVIDCSIVDSLPLVVVETLHVTSLRRQTDIVQSYIQLCKNTVGDQTFEGMHIVVDANGGAAISCYAEVFQAFGVQTIGVADVPGKFWRRIEPRQEYLAGLDKHFVSEMDMAICFDCDADRVEFVLRDGRVVSGQHVFALVMQEYLHHFPQHTVVVNDATSGLAHEVIAATGATVVEAEVGEANVIAMMESCDAVCGGEGSSGGAILFPTRCRDGILSTLLTLSLLKRTEKSLETLVASLPTYHTLREKLTGLSFADTRERFEAYGREHSYRFSYTGNHTGGMKMHIDAEHWAWIRGSKTEPGVVRLILDGKDEAQLQDMKAQLCRLFEHC
jgi:phosphomannomutase